MDLLNIITSDMKTAMKNKDSFKLSVIRMVKGALDLEKINKRDNLTEDEIISIISKQIKMREYSCTEFKKAGRMDLVEQHEEEIKILLNYMPEQLTKEEVEKIIDDAFTRIKPTSIKEMGSIMKEVTPLLKGKTDMSYVSTYIKKLLG